MNETRCERSPNGRHEFVVTGHVHHGDGLAEEYRACLHCYDRRVYPLAPAALERTWEDLGRPWDGKVRRIDGITVAPLPRFAFMGIPYGPEHIPMRQLSARISFTAEEVAATVHKRPGEAWHARADVHGGEE
jgi:hypothetical protein